MGLAVIGDVTPPARRQKTMAILQSVMAIASVIAPLIGGALGDSGPTGWRWIFYINMPFGAVAIAAVWIAMRKFELPVHDLPVDGWGSLFVAAGSTCIVLFVIWGGSPTGYAWDSATIICLIVASVSTGRAAMRAVDPHCLPIFSVAIVCCVLLLLACALLRLFGVCAYMCACMRRLAF